MDLQALRKALGQSRIEWRKHVLQRLAERGLAQADVLQVVLSGEMISEYADDKPFPSALFLGYVGGKPFHVVAAYDDASDRAFIITAQVPQAELFKYASELRSMTGGRASFEMAYSHYEQVPAHITQKVVAEVAAAKKA